MEVLRRSLKSIQTWGSLFCSPSKCPMHTWLQAVSLGLFVSDRRKDLETRKWFLGNTLSDRMLMLLNLHSHGASLDWRLLETISTRVKEEVNWELKPSFLCVCLVCVRATFFLPCTWGEKSDSKWVLNACVHSFSVACVD